MPQKHEKLLVFDTWNWCQPHKKTGNHLSWNQLLLYIPSSSQLFTVEPAAGTKSNSNKNNNDKMIIRRRILIKSRRRKRIELSKSLLHTYQCWKKTAPKNDPFSFFPFRQRRWAPTRFKKKAALELVISKLKILWKKNAKNMPRGGMFHRQWLTANFLECIGSMVWQISKILNSFEKPPF